MVPEYYTKEEKIAFLKKNKWNRTKTGDWVQPKLKDVYDTDEAFKKAFILSKMRVYKSKDKDF